MIASIIDMQIAHLGLDTTLVRGGRAMHIRVRMLVTLRIRVLIVVHISMTTLTVSKLYITRRLEAPGDYRKSYGNEFHMRNCVRLPVRPMWLLMLFVLTS